MSNLYAQSIVIIALWLVFCLYLLHETGAIKFKRWRFTGNGLTTMCFLFVAWFLPSCVILAIAWFTEWVTK